MFSALSCSTCHRPPELDRDGSCTSHPACPSCGFARYCSPECRQQHRGHLSFCAALAELRSITTELEPPPEDDDAGWMDYRRNELMLAAFMLGGQLPLSVQNSILWQQACSYCFSSAPPLSLCPDCRAVCFCQQHAGQVLAAHRHVCALLAANQRCGQLIHASIARSGRPPTYLPAAEGAVGAAAGETAAAGTEEGRGEQPSAEPPSLDSWGGYFRWRGCPVGAWSNAEQRCYTSTLTWPLSLVHGLRLLQAAGAALPAPLPPTLRVHLLGATDDCEAQCLAKYEEVLHCLPAGVRRLELTLVGPELPKGGAGGAGQPALCEECRAQGRSMHIVLRSGSTYHAVARRPPPSAAKRPTRSSFNLSFNPLGKGKQPAKPAQPGPGAVDSAGSCRRSSSSSGGACSQHASVAGGSSPGAAGGAGAEASGSSGSRNENTAAAASSSGGWEPPHAAFMFNSGLHEDTEEHQRAWLPTVRLLRDAGVPTVMTAYTEGEARADAAVLDRLGCGLVLEPQENPFRADVPLVDCEKRYNVYYINGWLLGFQGKA